MRRPRSGVRHVVIGRKGKRGNARQALKRRAFHRTVKWRTGSESRINTLKNGLRVKPHPDRWQQSARSAPGTQGAGHTWSMSR